MVRISRPEPMMDKLRYQKLLNVETIQSCASLLEKGANIHSKEKGGKTPFLFAAHYGNTQTLISLLENGADIESRDNSGCTALSLATSTGNMETVQFLVEKGVDIDS
jgi:ankyrin repeat protein